MAVTDIADPIDDFEYSSSDSEDTARNIRLAHYRASESLLSPHRHSGRSSSSSTATATPIPSRSPSPLPPFLQSYTSDTDSESASPFLRNRAQDHRRRWWMIYSQRRRKRDGRTIRFFRKWTRQLVRHPFFPRQPVTVLLTLIVFSGFAIFLTLLIMYILNPDKEPLPWRAYCSIPSLTAPPEATTQIQARSSHPSHYPFPPHNLDSLPPAGVFVGVFSVDSSFERRSLIRTTWANHPRSRYGADNSDNGVGTSRTIVRFILGQPRKDWERRIGLEMERYNDIVILPTTENMNSGKTHTFFSWAAVNAWVPPLNSTVHSFSYSNYSAPPPPSSSHDPPLNGPLQSWVRPDFVVKVDDDAFVMLAELESRLRVELYSPPANSNNAGSKGRNVKSNSDPLIYWGYLVTNRLHRFMAGELYALSWSLVDWVAKDPNVKTMTKGAEDKQTAKWMKSHPRASEVRWTSERCWIYDHPRAGTVYTHGFLFPSEVTRVKRDLQYPDTLDDTRDPSASIAPTPASWAHSSVSTFGVRYERPLPNLTPLESVEALVEGSNMSLIREGDAMTPGYAWEHREGRKKRYEGNRVGGTVVIHFIKKNVWFLEAALAMLDGDDVTFLESLQS